MGIYYSVGQALVSDDELREKQFLEDFDFTREIEFSTGRFDPQLHTMGVSLDSEKPMDFKPIGVGKPLLIEIREVYPGNHLRKKPKDMLVTSAFKSFATFNAQPRAINIMKKDAIPGTAIDRISAVEQGTSLVFYTGALTNKNSNVAIEFGFNEFDDSDFKTVGELFSNAAGLPIFAPASGILMVASGITKLIGKVGELLNEKRQVFRTSENIVFMRGGDTKAKFGFTLLDDDRTPFSQEERQKYELNTFGKLVDEKGAPYRGDTPYVVLSYDGRKMDEYKDFAPTHASAEILERFYSTGVTSSSSAVDILSSALKLYNDKAFLDKANEKTKEIKNLDPNEDEDKKEIARLTTLRDAYIKNIRDDAFKPKKVSNS